MIPPVIRANVETLTVISSAWHTSQTQPVQKTAGNTVTMIMPSAVADVLARLAVSAASFERFETSGTGDEAAEALLTMST